MRRKVVYTLLLCMAWTLNVSAQNTVEGIRKVYQGVHEWIAQMDKGFPSDGIPSEYYDLRVEQNLPATGPHHENIRMFYGEEEPEDEEEDYNPYPPHYLCFVTAKDNSAAREFYEEYLYDNKGNVIFIYALTPDVEYGEPVPYELRMWFDGKRLLRFTAKKVEGPLDVLDIASLRKATWKEEYSGTVIPEKYSGETDRCQQRAQRFLTMFKGIDDNTYL